MWKRIQRMISRAVYVIRGKLRVETYHPEAHYMRGPGPKTMARNQRAHSKLES